MSANMRAPMLFGDFADAIEIDDARISGSATDDQFRFVLFGDSLQLVVVDRFGFARDAIVRDFVTDAGKVHRMAVRQMPAVRKVHAENLVAVLNRRQVNGHVRLRAAVRLDVRMIGAEQFLRAIDGRLLDDVAHSQPP